MVPPSQVACVACGCNPLRSLRSYHRFRWVRVISPIVQGCRVSTDDRPVPHAVAVLASLALLAGECIALEVQRRVGLVVVRASQHILWGRLCLATSSSRQTRKWHYRLYNDCMDLRHHTLTSSADSDRRLCILAFGCCLVLPSSSTFVMTLN